MIQSLLLLISLACYVAAQGVFYDGNGNACNVYVTGLSVISYTTPDSSTWQSPWVQFGCTDNGFPTNTTTTPCNGYSRGLNLNSGAGGKYVFIGAKVEGVCEGSTNLVMTNATLSSDPTCASVGDGSWAPARGQIDVAGSTGANVNDGISTAPALYVCIKYGTISNTNLWGIYLSHFTYPVNTPQNNWGTYYTGDLNAGTGAAPIYLTMRMTECGGQCSNGGACIDTACYCKSGNCPVVSTAGRSIGCYGDNAQAHDLPYRVNYTVTASTVFSPNQCLASCINAGFAYAGIQNGGDCYCGNSYGANCPSATGVCKQPCNNIAGSPLNVSSQICGAVNFNNIYRANMNVVGAGQTLPCTCVSPGNCAGVTASVTAFGCATASDASTIDFTIASTTGGVAPYKYSVSGSPLSANTQFSVATEGNYSVTVVDATGTTFVSSVFAGPAKRVNVTAVPFVPYGTLAGYRTSTVGSVDAMLNATAGNGTAPYKYTLYPAGLSVAYAGTSAGGFSALSAGAFNLIATDANGCRSNPVPITVYTPVLAAAPSVINVTDMNIGQKPMATVAWLAPYFNGYSAITGYSVLLGYWNDATSSIVWTSNVTSSSTSASIADVMNNSTRRFVSIATINGVGLGAYSTAVEFVGLCAAGRYANSTICQDCVAGTNTLATIGRSVCRPCAAGTYSGPAAPVCSSCTGNTFSVSGAASCSPCGPGYITQSYYCQPCAAGNYNNGTSTTCTPCPANTYASQPGSSGCVACPAGLTSSPGAYQCQDSTGYKKK